LKGPDFIPGRRYDAKANITKKLFETGFKYYNNLGGNPMSNDNLILVVDDDPDLVESVSMKLEDKGFRIAKAYDGVEAWEKIKAERPSLIVLDVMMPRKNGYELCDEIKNDPQYKDIIVVLLTAVADAVPKTSYTHMDGKNTLADDFVPKPIDLDKLMEIVTDNLE
jgi:CheY-like chemotaxis protein